MSSWTRRLAFAPIILFAVVLSLVLFDLIVISLNGDITSSIENVGTGSRRESDFEPSNPFAHRAGPDSNNDNTNINDKKLMHDGPAAEVSKRKKVAVSITITKDGPYVDGAAILAESVLRARSRYDIDLVAVVLPEVQTSRPPLRRLGFKIIEREKPVKNEEIRGPLKNQIEHGGCCGSAELLKLEMFRLHDYWKIIALDMDSMILKNFDELLLIDKQMLYTTDPMMNKGGYNVEHPFQGGFFIVKPNEKVFNDIVEIVKRGEFGGQGWEKSRIGYHWGGATIQGVLPFYYHTKAPKDSFQEIDRCRYNNMADDNCKVMDVGKVSTSHFTNCQKPWSCIRTGVKLCNELTDIWWVFRRSLEDRMGFERGEQCVKHKYQPLPL